MSYTDRLTTPAELAIIPPANYTVPYYSAEDGMLYRLTDTGTSQQLTMPLQAEIPQGADLDDYKRIGMYMCVAVSAVTSLSHCPTTTAFCLRVQRFAASAYMQEVKSSQGIWRRFCSNSGVWQQWLLQQQSVSWEIHVGPDRQIQTLAQLASYMDAHPCNSRMTIIYFDPGTYSGNLNINRGNPNLVPLGGTKGSVVIDGNVTLYYTDICKIQNMVITGALNLRYGSFCTSVTNTTVGSVSCVYMNQALFNTVDTAPQESYTGSSFSVFSCNYVSAINCSFAPSAACTISDPNSVNTCNNFLSQSTTYGGIVRSSGGSSLFVSSVPLATVLDCTFKDAYYGITNYHSFVRVQNALTLENITGVQVSAMYGATMLISPTSVTRTNVTGTLCSPVAGTVGNVNSYISANSIFTTT